MRNAGARIHEALPAGLALVVMAMMAMGLASVALIATAAPANAMLGPDSIAQLLKKAGLQTSDLSSPVVWKLYSENTESADPQETRAVSIHQAWRGYVPVDGSQPSGYASGNSDDVGFDITIEFITLDYLGSQRDYMLTAEGFREHYLGMARKEANSSYETSAYDGLPGGVMRVDRADVDKQHPEIGSSMYVYFWKGPGYVGHIYYSGSCTAATPYHETLRARTVRQEAFIRQDCPKLAGIVYNRMPEYRAVAGSDPGAAQAATPPGAGKAPGGSTEGSTTGPTGQSAANRRQPGRTTEKSGTGQASSAVDATDDAKKPATKSAKLPDAALPVAVGATAGLAALGALAAASANGVSPREAVGGVAGLFNAKAGTIASDALPPAALPPVAPDAGTAASAKRALDVIEAARQQYAPQGWQTQHGEVGSAAFRQLALTDALKNAPSGASIIMSDDEAGRPQSILDATQPGRWVGISEKARAAYERGDYKEVEGLLNEGWKEDMRGMGYSTARETLENLKVLDKFTENTTRPAAVVHKYVEGKLHRKVME
jgi:hypothetical protein